MSVFRSFPDKTPRSCPTEQTAQSRAEDRYQVHLHDLSNPVFVWKPAIAPDIKTHEQIENGNTLSLLLATSLDRITHILSTFGLASLSTSLPFLDPGGLQPRSIKAPPSRCDQHEYPPDL